MKSIIRKSCTFICVNGVTYAEKQFNHSNLRTFVKFCRRFFFIKLTKICKETRAEMYCTFRRYDVTYAEFKTL